ncbi:hypothetical protein [Nocardioides sp. GY 10127]|uniref:hypothetical protein n=1 Tax=Nocardioides sp. GY 10127 TaxID=2569762 RepID=UPI0010A87A46|nr:hypothetical protein [Nocardioides sp. GY 10127]TIC79932.1 hypothetical protein E8D37_14900 [Nocardioides sp. GY 10127]
MTNQPKRKSVGSAWLGVLTTLLIFVASFAFFLIAPIAMLLGALLVHTVMTAKQKAKSGGGGGGSAAGSGSGSGFGAGAQ